jgi:hypothetical protein
LQTFKIRTSEKGNWEEMVHDCPYCTGSIYYNVNTGSVTCPYCHKSVDIGLIVNSDWYRVAYHQGKKFSNIS